MILAIDPGNEQSAYVAMDEETYRPVEIGIVPNMELRTRIMEAKEDQLVIEMVASYGMAVGKEVFETVFWIGRFLEAGTRVFYDFNCHRIYRQDEKLNLCHDSRAKDGNIRQALIDRFGVVGTKKAQGWFYGFKADIWAAYAVGVTFADILNGKYIPRK